MSIKHIIEFDWDTVNHRIRLKWIYIVRNIEEHRRTLFVLEEILILVSC